MTNSKEIIWVKDKRGDHHVCYINEVKGDKTRYENLTEDEKKHCYTDKVPWS